MLESYLKKRLKTKKILLMTHIVMGYPSFEKCFQMIETMVAAGVDLMELQIPFSEPIADGAIILNANQSALASGTKVSQCFDLGASAATQFDIPFLFMTYANILFKCGMQSFAALCAQRGIKGAIVPDLPPEEGKEYLTAMQSQGLAPIFIFAPTTPKERMRYLSSCGQGFIYCVARKGVTGQETRFSATLEHYLQRCRKATNLPIAVGFGVKHRRDVRFLTGKADIAVIGSETIRLLENHGINAVGDFICDLRS